MTKYHRPAVLSVPTYQSAAAPKPPAPGFHAPMLDPDPLTPETTVYWDQSTGAQQPGAGGPQVASRIYYDNTLSLLAADNVQDAIDIIDNQLDLITGASSGLDSRVDVLEVEMDEAQADITALEGRMTTAEGNITTLQVTDTNLQVQIDALDVRTDETEADITDLIGRMVDVENKNVAQDGRLDAIEAVDLTQNGRLNVAEADIDALQAADTAFDGRMTAAEGDIDALQAADVALDARLDTAETNITTLQGKTNQATETVAGIAEIATSAEVTTGADDQRIVTPLKLAARLAALPGAAPATETVAGIAEIATDAEVTAGTDDTRIVSPKKLETRINARLAGYVLKTGDTMSGNLTIARADPYLVLNNVGGSAPHLLFQNNGITRSELGYDGTNARRYENIYDAAGAFVWTALSVGAGGIGVGTIPGHRFHVQNAGFVQSHIQATTADQARQGYQNTTRYWVSGNIDGEWQVWDMTAGVKRFVIAVDGQTYIGLPNCTMWTGGDLYTHHINCQGGQIWAYGLRGGPGDAGNLRCHSTANMVNFRWDNYDLLYRIDESVERKIMWTSTNAADFRVISGQPGATGIGAFISQPYNTGTAYGWYVDYVSDPKLKSDIAPSTVDALAAINAIDVIRYRWNPDALEAAKHPRWHHEVELGLNAAQLQTVIPDMAHRNEGVDGLLRLNLKQGVPWLIKAVQQLSARVVELEKRHAY